MTEVASLLVRIEASTALLRSELARADKAVGQTAGGIERSAARAEQAAQQMAAGISNAYAGIAKAQERINALTGVTRAPTADRAADIEAYGRALDAMRAKLVPAVALEQTYAAAVGEADHALKVGAISQAEHGDAVKRAKASYDAGVASLRGIEQAAGGAAKASRLSTMQLQTLKYTASDVVASLGSGMSPMQVALQQGPQVAQAFSLSITSMTAAIAGAALAVGVLVAANSSYSSSMRAVTVANQLMGGAIGLTRDQLEQVAQRAAAAGEVSVRAARDQEAAYIRTGKIGAEVMEGLIGLSRGYAVATGKDAAEAAEDLAKLFTDPVRGAEELTKAFGLLSDKQLEHIRTLARQGQATEAQKLLMEALNARVSNLARDGLSTLAQAWDRVARAISNAFDAAGRATAPETNEQAIARLEAKRRELAAAKKLDADRVDAETGGQAGADAVPVDSRYAAPGMVKPAGASDELQKVEAELARRTADRARAREQAARVGDHQGHVAGSRVAGDAARSLDPLHGDIAEMQQRISDLERGAGNPEVSDPGQVSAGLERARNRLSGLEEARNAGVSVETLKAQKLGEVQAKAAGMGERERARYLAQEQARIELLDASLTASEKDAKVRAAVVAVTAQQATATSDATRQLKLQADAADRLAGAAGKGEAAERRAGIENDVAAASITGLGPATRTTREREEAAKLRAIRADETADINLQIKAQLALIDTVGKGPAALAAALTAQKAHTLALREGEEGTERYRQAFEAYLAKLGELDKASRTLAEQQALYQEMESFGEQAFERIGSAATAMAMEGKDAFATLRNIGKATVSELMQEFFKLAAINPLKNALLGTTAPTLSTMTGFIGSLFGGSAPAGAAAPAAAGGTVTLPARAAGGPVNPSEAYVVGEKRPELFVPNVPGVILPRVPELPSAGNGAEGSAPTVIVQQTMHFGVGVNAAARAEVLNMLPQIKSATVAAVEDRMQRGVRR
ncbi:phage tail length tape measure family protein [Azospirillum sp. sgz302134]